MRADIVDFLHDQLGYDVLAFEQPSFPIDPDADTIENSRRRVEKEADVLVLIVGGRYGHVDDKSGKSVTNLEYLSARMKRIPIYVFVHTQILAHYEAWCKNPANRFEGLIDDPKLFEFIRLIREEHKMWMVSFDRAQDIVKALSSTFALMRQMKQRFQNKGSLSDNAWLQHQGIEQGGSCVSCTFVSGSAATSVVCNDCADVRQLPDLGGVWSVPIAAGTPHLHRHGPLAGGVAMPSATAIFSD